MKTSDISSNPEYYHTIRNALKGNPYGNKTIDKWFSHMGLKNFKEDVIMPGVNVLKKNHVIPIITESCHIIDDLTDQPKLKLGGPNKTRLSLYMNQVATDLRLLKHEWRQNDKTNCTLNVSGGKIPKGRRIAPLIEKKIKEAISLSVKYSGMDMNDADDEDAVYLKHALSSCRGVQGKKVSGLKVCFSAAGEEGAWDIATMSMRGISSCMRWGSDHSNALVGSILDPCCGVIYLTSGLDKGMGAEMLARAVVRIVLVSKKPHIMIDRIYTANNYMKLVDIKNIFTKYLRKNLSKKYSIIQGKASLQIPKGALTIDPDPAIDDYHSYASYRDTRNQYTQETYSASKLFQK